MFKIGQKVYDHPTKHYATIVDTCLAESDSGPFTIYILDSSIPDDPDYPHRHRLENEIEADTRS